MLRAYARQLPGNYFNSTSGRCECAVVTPHPASACSCQKFASLQEHEATCQTESWTAFRKGIFIHVRSAFVVKRPRKRGTIRMRSLFTVDQSLFCCAVFMLLLLDFNIFTCCHLHCQQSVSHCSNGGKL